MSLYAYVRSKQNVRNKVGPLEDNAGNIITQGFLMAEELNRHFSSVFTRENTSSLPVGRFFGISDKSCKILFSEFYQCHASCSQIIKL